MTISDPVSNNVRYVHLLRGLRMSLWSQRGDLTVFAILRTVFTAPGRVGAGWPVHDVAQDGPAVAVAQAAAGGTATVRFVASLEAGNEAVGGGAIRPVALPFSAVLSLRQM